MKKFFLALSLLLAGTILSAQIRDYVGIVRQQYYPSHVEFLENLRDSLKDRGYKTYASYVDSYLKGGFGSGFIYVAPDGTNYVITNNHVVSQAASASIEFENAETGALNKYEKLSVLITDDDIDIAILKFEGDENPFKNGLTLSSAKLKDGDEVYSAGFPGLGNEPVWQFGKGNVTNAFARIKDLIDPSISTIIQHSAQVDAGNSGGPLMIASKNGTAGYEVVGINTWKAIGRDSTNFSLPVNLAIKLIEKSKAAVNDDAVKAERLASLKKLLTDSASDYTSVVKFISYEYASANGENDLEQILSYGSTDVRNRVVNEFAYNPLEGIRYAVAYNFFEKYSGENATDENLAELNWIKEHGIFRLNLSEQKSSKKAKASSEKKSSDTKAKSSDKSKSKKNLKVKFNGVEGEDFFAIKAGMVISFKDSDSIIKTQPGFAADLMIFPGTEKMWGFGINYENKKFGDNNFNLFGGCGAFRIPLNFNFFCISPKITGGIGIGRGEWNLMYSFAEAGIETVFNFGNDYFRPGFEIGYKGTAYKITSKDNMTIKNANLSFKVILGFAL